MATEAVKERKVGEIDEMSLLMYCIPRCITPILCSNLVWFPVGKTSWPFPENEDMKISDQMWLLFLLRSISSLLSTNLTVSSVWVVWRRQCWLSSLLTAVTRNKKNSQYIFFILIRFCTLITPWTLSRTVFIPTQKSKWRFDLVWYQKNGWILGKASVSLNETLVCL